MHIFRMKTETAVALPAAVVLWAGMGLWGSAWAQSGDNGDQANDGHASREMVVIASRIPQPMGQVATSVSTLDREQIQAHGNRGLVNILRQMPAMGSTTNGGAGATSSLRIRGEEGYRTLVIMDGLRLGDPSNTQVAQQPEHLLSAGVDRVEVLRGPQGLAYGADAGGVINIHSTAGRQGLGLEVQGESGSRDSRQYDVQMHGGSEAGFFALGATDLSTAGINQQVTDTSLRDHDGYDNQTLHGTLRLESGSGAGLQWTGRQVRGQSEFDGCFAGSIVHDCMADYELDAQRLAFTHQGEKFEHELSYSEVETRRENLALGASSFTAAGTIKRWDYLGSLHADSTWQWVYGADLEQAGNNAVSRDNLGVFLESIATLPHDLTLSLGLRHDDNDDFGHHLSYRASAAKLFELDTLSLKLRGSVGSGFRAPSPYEVAYNQGNFAFPPASLVALEEESSRGHEVGVDLYADNWRLQATWFSQTVEDAIIFDLSGFSGYLQESGRSRSRGLELATAMNLDRFWSLQANYTYNETRTPEDRQRLRRPRHMANLGLVFDASTGLRLSAWYRASRDAVDEQAGRRVTLEDMQVLDMNLNYTLFPHLELFLRAENLLDSDAREVIGYNAPGRAWFAGFRTEFR